MGYQPGGSRSNAGALLAQLMQIPAQLQEQRNQEKLQNRQMALQGIQGLGQGLQQFGQMRFAKQRAEIEDAMQRAQEERKAQEFSQTQAMKEKMFDFDKYQAQQGMDLKNRQFQREGEQYDTDYQRSQQLGDQDWGRKKEMFGMQAGESALDRSLSREQLQNQISAREMLEMLRQEGRIGLEGTKQEGRIGLEGARQEGRTGLESEKQKGRIGLEGVRQEGRTGLEGVRQGNRESLQKNEQEFQSGESAKYKEPVAKTPNEQAINNLDLDLLKLQDPKAKIDFLTEMYVDLKSGVDDEALKAAGMSPGFIQQYVLLSLELGSSEIRMNAATSEPARAKYAAEVESLQEKIALLKEMLRK